MRQRVLRETTLCRGEFPTNTLLNLRELGDCTICNAPASILTLCQGVKPYPFRPDGVDSTTADEADLRLEQLLKGTLSADEGIFIDVLPPATGSPVKNHFITNNAA